MASSRDLSVSSTKRSKVPLTWLRAAPTALATCNGSTIKFSPVAGGGHYHQERKFSGPSDFGQFWGVESESECYSVG